MTSRDSPRRSADPPLLEAVPVVRDWAVAAAASTPIPVTIDIQLWLLRMMRSGTVSYSSSGVRGDQPSDIKCSRSRNQDNIRLHNDAVAVAVRR